MTNTLSAATAQLITNLITRTWKLENNEYVALFTILSVIIAKIAEIEINYSYVIILVCVVAFGYLVKNFETFKQKLFQPKSSFIIQSPTERFIHRYFTIYKNYIINKPSFILNGRCKDDPRTYKEDASEFILIDNYVEFCDTSCGIKGNFTPRRFIVDPKDLSTEIFSIEMNIYNGDVMKYLEYIQKVIIDSKVKLYSVLLTKDRTKIVNSNLLFYDGPKIKNKINIEYFDTFYSDSKTELLLAVNTLINHNEAHPLFADQLNLCLYGPPGTGKSSFVYRLALALQRHIVKVNITNLESANRLYQIFQSPYIDELNKNVDPNNVIFVLDEFDKSIQQLLAIEEEHKSYLRDLTRYKIELEAARTKIDCKMPEEPKQIIKIDDLLSCLQGVVPLNGTIIIATTNNLESMQKQYPALFRHGRLTPVYMGYPSLAVFTEFCKSVWPTAVIPPKITNLKQSMSEIIYHQKTTKSFEEFCTKIA